MVYEKSLHPDRVAGQAYVAWQTDRNYAGHPYPVNAPGTSRELFWVVGLLDYGFEEGQRLCPETASVDETNTSLGGVWFGTAASAWREARGGYPDAPWVASYSFNAWMHSEGGPVGYPLEYRYGTIDKILN